MIGANIWGTLNADPTTTDPTTQSRRSEFGEVAPGNIDKTKWGSRTFGEGVQHRLPEPNIGSANLVEKALTKLVRAQIVDSFPETLRTPRFLGFVCRYTSERIWPEFL